MPAAQKNKWPWLALPLQKLAAIANGKNHIVVKYAGALATSTVFLSVVRILYQVSQTRCKIFFVHKVLSLSFKFPV